MKVCIVDDYAINIFILEEFLKSRPGYDTVSFSNAHDCIEYLKTNEVDVVLMDCSMPEMSGYDATMEIKKMKPYLRVIGITANTFEEDLKRCYEYGMEYVIVKPIFPNELFDRLGRKN